ncbi:MAG TPA: CYTH domain-containing protein [Candidatus Baltobacteraceae bacterium]|nr:CYTH domain-containing protein [Candidatus Baltobacteraceae bacterium]
MRSGEAPDAIVPRLLELRAKKTRTKPVIVAVAGGSGDGKGHLIGRLIARLNASDGVPSDAVAVLPLDNYYIGVERMRTNDVPHFDHPDALDLALAAEHLAKARVAKTLKIPTYDFPSGERVGEEVFTAKAFVFVDGLFALRHPDILAVADFKIFVRSDHDSSMLRRLFRDAGPNGRTQQSSREVLQQYFATVWPAKKEFIDPTADDADVIVESRYDAAVEAFRAGPIQYQLKARGDRPDDHVVALCRAARLGARVRQVDRFMQPKSREFRGEMLRLRIENDDVLLTYKGPFIDGQSGARHATSPIELPLDAMRWFTDDYQATATFKKHRTLFQAGDIVIARDDVEGLGKFFEVRSTSERSLAGMHALLGQLCPREPVLTQSYLELWKERVSASTAP